jgi:hypothetical protein
LGGILHSLYQSALFQRPHIAEFITSHFPIDQICRFGFIQLLSGDYP